jgi:hypothetical protein
MSQLVRVFLSLTNRLACWRRTETDTAAVLIDRFGRVQVAVRKVLCNLGCGSPPLDAARRGEHAADDQYEWAVIEFLDQMVRHRSGSEMLHSGAFQKFRPTISSRNASAPSTGVPATTARNAHPTELHFTPSASVAFASAARFTNGCTTNMA